ncbi:hypothetical protein L2U69_16915 [Zavarzinia compransoris]|uniref:ABC transporter transmembrane domain-containing protein n=1 Tax=Zavarzinia marina TaxID=2911065 RepID=UPI001EFF5BF3|nr:ABC transporter transmembrane domain-containing protein [Zavarzinia marina]MCF4167333.1 hypothetical protein [Zavarzinia marina]
MDTNLFRYAWRHSKGQQLVLLAVIIISLPFYWISLEVPKQIANDAIQGRAFADGNLTATLFDMKIGLPAFLGGGNLVISEGLDLERLPFLLVLSGWFLALVFVNGAFKYFINLRKGVLGETMLRRMRHDLFVLLLRFRPEDVAAVKPAEAASMIKDEVDPIGGFIGDAFIQPVFLGTQAATALIFIFVQSVWMGIAAAAVVTVQAVIIPLLRREQLRLGRMRQIESRRFAGRIGEVVETASTVHTFGASADVDADVANRLGTLFTIRARLFKRKFAVKFLNNMLSQVTPFAFYSVGGYFALRGEMDIGQLIAVIAAYRDLPPPIKELIDWDQQRQDVTIKYEQVIKQFSPSKLLPPFDEAAGGNGFPASGAPIEIRSVSIGDGRGGHVLDRLSLTLARPGHIAFLDEVGGARDVLCRLIGRQITEYEGSIAVGDCDLSSFPEATLARHLTYCGPSPDLSAGSLRDNLLIGLRRMTAAPGEDDVDYSRLGPGEGPETLSRRLHEAIDAVGGNEHVRRLGLNSRLEGEFLDHTADRIVAARRLLHERIETAGLTHVIERFDATRYNRQATIGENLMFGIPVGGRLKGTGLAHDPFTLSILEAEGLLGSLLAGGRKIAEMAVETFAGLPPDHPVFERYSFLSPSLVEELTDVLDALAKQGDWGPTPALRGELLELVFEFIEPRHRIGLLTPEFRARLLRARQSFQRHLPHELRDAIEFYDYDRYMRQAPMLDNLLFGRIAGDKMHMRDRIVPLVTAVLTELGLDETVFDLGMRFDVGKGGQNLHPQQRARFAVARALLRRPEILVLNGTLGALPAADAATLLDGVRRAMAGRTLITSLGDGDEAEGFDAVYRFKGGRLVSGGA